MSCCEIIAGQIRVPRRTCLLSNPLLSTGVTENPEQTHSAAWRCIGICVFIYQIIACTANFLHRLHRVLEKFENFCTDQDQS
jgi:hypothetical protein